MLDVGDDEFLVLLFMVQAKREDGRKLCQPVLIDRFQQCKDVLIHVPPIGIRLLNGWPRDESSFWSAMPFSEGVVIRVKEIRILGMQRLIPRNGGKEQEGFEKPTDVGEMPFGWADIWHGLNDKIFGDQRFAQLLRKASNVLVLLDEIRTRCRLQVERT